jgi:hypothetical protein
MNKIYVGLMTLALAVIAVSGVYLYNTQTTVAQAPYEGQGVPRPSTTEGHHGGELAGEAFWNNKYSLLQHGSPDAERDDYLIVCGGTSSNPVTGHVYNVGTGFHGVRDAGRGCNGKDFPFNGEGHSIAGRDYSRHD